MSLNIEYVVLTVRTDNKGGDRVIESRTFEDDLDAAQTYVRNEPIAIPPEDQGQRWVKFSRVIRRVREPQL